MEVAELLDVRRVAEELFEAGVVGPFGPRVALPALDGVEDVVEWVSVEGSADDAAPFVVEGGAAGAAGGELPGFEDLAEIVAATRVRLRSNR